MRHNLIFLVFVALRASARDVATWPSDRERCDVFAANEATLIAALETSACDRLVVTDAIRLGSCLRVLYARSLTLELAPGGSLVGPSKDAFAAAAAAEEFSPSLSSPAMLHFFDAANVTVLGAYDPAPPPQALGITTFDDDDGIGRLFRPEPQLVGAAATFAPKRTGRRASERRRLVVPTVKMASKSFGIKIVAHRGYGLLKFEQCSGCAARGLSLSNAPTFGVAVVASADVALEKVRVGLGASRRDPLRSYKNTNALVVAGSRRVSCRVATLESANEAVVVRASSAVAVEDASLLLGRGIALGPVAPGERVEDVAFRRVMLRAPKHALRARFGEGVEGAAPRVANVSASDFYVQNANFGVLVDGSPTAAELGAFEFSNFRFEHSDAFEQYAAKKGYMNARCCRCAGFSDGHARCEQCDAAFPARACAGFEIHGYRETCGWLYGDGEARTFDHAFVPRPQDKDGKKQDRKSLAWLDAHGHLVPRWQSVCGDPSFRGDVVEAAAGLDAEGLHGLVSEKYRED